MSNANESKAKEVYWGIDINPEALAADESSKKCRSNAAFSIRATGPKLLRNGHQEEMRLVITNTSAKPERLCLASLKSPANSPQNSSLSLYFEFHLADAKKKNLFSTFGADKISKASTDELQISSAMIPAHSEIILAYAFRTDSSGSGSNPLHSAEAMQWSLWMNGEVKSGTFALRPSSPKKH